MTKEEYERKFYANTLITGHGLDTTIHMPCPFCAEPDFMVYKILETEAAMRRESICRHCSRGTMGIITPQPGGGGMTIEVVQTQGPDGEPFMQWMRRVPKPG